MCEKNDIDLNEVRNRIDLIDDQLVKLLEERLHIVQELSLIHIWKKYWY